MAAIEAEDQRQFCEYFAARRDTVRRLGYVLSGDWHLADDLTQAAFLRLAGSWSRIRDRGALDAFVRTCLIRAYLAERRRAWRWREDTVAALPDVASPGDRSDDVDRRLILTAALRKVPPRQLAALVCRYYLALDIAETARTLGCSEGTVKSQTARGLATLRELLGGSVVDPTPAPESTRLGEAKERLSWS
jgi:RNA polymerase sigma-70 factor (sigma-E family)